MLLFALVANTSIASLNLSLLVNSVGFYQASVWPSAQRPAQPAGIRTNTALRLIPELGCASALTDLPCCAVLMLCLQITKLLIIPCVCLLELVLQQKRLTVAEFLSIATVVLGVGIV